MHLLHTAIGMVSTSMHSAFLYWISIWAFAVIMGKCQLDIRALGNSQRPKQSSSPGWKETPRDMAILLGGHIRFNCTTYLFHTETLWMKDGELVSNRTSKVTISRDNTSLTFGPVTANDDGSAIGCEIKSLYGMLPSTSGKIIVQSIPAYNVKKLQLAHAGQPFQFDFNYTAPTPPSIFLWRKNGKIMNDQERITVDHTGISFTRVLPQDAGQYTIQARTQSGIVTATSTLKVILFRRGSFARLGSSRNPIKSSKLAVLVALSQNGADSSTSASAFHVSKNSTAFTARYGQHVLRLFLQFKRPSSSSRQSGHARLETERLLIQISRLLGGNPKNLTLSDRDMARIADRAKCISTSFPRCSLKDLRFRSADGTCNNFFYPENGASGRAFARILPANYEDGISAPVGLNQIKVGKPFEPPWPSPRLISWKLINDLKIRRSDRISHMFMQWGQFLDHDLDIAPVFDEDNSICNCSLTPICVPIKVKPDDAVFGTGGSNKGACLPFARSVPVCSRYAGSGIPRNQVNDLTSYIDASNVYGSTKKLANELRLFKAGLLKQGGRLETLKGNLPFQDDSPDDSSLPFFVAGDSRVNEQLGLTIMHTIWMREHNRIARTLMRINPCWNDERIYQETRRIVGAMMQIITFKEFLPRVFGRFHFRTYIPRYRGYNPFIDATIPNSFAGAAYRFGHSLVKDQFDRLDRNYRRLSIGPLPLERAFFNPISYFESLGTDPILRGLTIVKSNPVDEFLNSVLTSKLFVEKTERLGGDLASLNIQRGRDHGLPTYRQWERFCRRLFPGIRGGFRRRATTRKLRELYGSRGFREGIDLWVGGLAEKKIRGGQIGPTFACIFAITFLRVRDGDRFWYENPYVFTPRQRIELQKTTLAKVICTNGDDIPTIQRNVFLTGRRVKCTSIPAISLWRWWDKKCYNKRPLSG